jgi:2,3-bisphosphoglycerate-dependent phosphoglycerate mutase
MSNPSPKACMSLLFLRHGATALNTAGLRCGGDIDLPLTELGLQQAARAAARLAAIRPRIGLIVVSGLQRTRQTADIIGRHLHGVPIIVEPAFDERRLGAWNRRPIVENQADLEVGVTPPGGECNADFMRRIGDAVALTLLPRLGQRPLLVASKGVARVLGELTGLAAQEPLDNVDIAEFDLSTLCERGSMVCAA